MNQQAGKLLLLIGGCLVVLGMVVYFLGNKLHWIGRLPGDIRVERGNFRFYAPITTMILASLLFTLLLHILKRFL